MKKFLAEKHVDIPTKFVVLVHIVRYKSKILFTEPIPSDFACLLHQATEQSATPKLWNILPPLII